MGSRKIVSPVYVSTCLHRFEPLPVLGSVPSGVDATCLQGVYIGLVPVTGCYHLLGFPHAPATVDNGKRCSRSALFQLSRLQRLLHCRGFDSDVATSSIEKRFVRLGEKRITQLGNRK